ncbi:TIGR02281 family clan AA aspartic protease [Capnocytophaga canimorsus]|uniref:retropepsin-like aspartic protease family protein n=1 Tax=Capnocytophaga canimorsus TaxID=28188 RepID=UPI00384FB6E0
MKTNTLHIALLLSFLLQGCTNCSKKEEPSWIYSASTSYDTTVEDTNSTEIETDDLVRVPYQLRNNAMIVPVKINGIGLDMIFDTGASITCITLAEAEYLAKKGLLTKNDFIDLESFQVADGSVSVGLKINLREVTIGDKVTLRNIQALVVEHLQAPLLLGQSVMREFKEISFDNQKQEIKFYLKGY